MVKVIWIKFAKVRYWEKTGMGCYGCPAKGQLSKLEAKDPSWRQKVRLEGVSQGLEICLALAEWMLA